MVGETVLETGATLEGGVGSCDTLGVPPTFMFVLTSVLTSALCSSARASSVAGEGMTSDIARVCSAPWLGVDVSGNAVGTSIPWISEGRKEEEAKEGRGGYDSEEEGVSVAMPLGTV